MFIVPQVTYKTPVPTGDVYFVETFDDGTLDRYSLTNNHQALLKNTAEMFDVAMIHEPPVVLSDQDKLIQSVAAMRVWVFTFFSFVEAKSLVMLISTDGRCQRR